MAYQKVVKKNKPWETPELIAARSESVRMHTLLKYPAIKIAKLLGKNPNQIARWLTAAGIYKPLTAKQIAKIRRPVWLAQSAARKKRNQEMASIKTMERLSRLYICKECKISFKPTIKFQEFCTPACRTKSYLKLNRDVIAEKSRRKSENSRKSRAERLYASREPRCNFCQKQIPFPRFYQMNCVKFCSQECSQKAQSKIRKTDPNKAAAYKIIRAKTYLKRKLNGKNRLERREYFRNNIQARIGKNLRSRLQYAVKSQGGKKCDSSMNLTGADWQTLSAWIQNKFQSGMSWDNYGLWHVDHLIPCVAFDLTKPEQQRACFHYKNLQPLWGIENIKKGAKIL